MDMFVNEFCTDRQAARQDLQPGTAVWIIWTLSPRGPAAEEGLFDFGLTQVKIPLTKFSR